MSALLRTAGKATSELLPGPGKSSSLPLTPARRQQPCKSAQHTKLAPTESNFDFIQSRGLRITPVVFCPRWCLDIRQYLRSLEQDLKKTLLREKLCSSLLLISFLSCASAKKEIKLLPARANVKPWSFQCQDCYLSFFLVLETFMCPSPLNSPEKVTDLLFPPLGKLLPPSKMKQGPR